MPGAPRIGERDAASLPLRQREAEVRLEHAQLLADGGGRDGELVGSGTHRAEARNGVEGTHRV
jgi:hypothetical protein